MQTNTWNTTGIWDTSGFGFGSGKESDVDYHEDRELLDDVVMVAKYEQRKHLLDFRDYDHSVGREERSD
jgi:hypothetical protein